MASEYKDRVVHQWYVENFIKPYFVPQFISTSYAGIERRGMHKESKDVQKAMRNAKSKWKNYYIFYGIYTVQVLDIKGSLFLLKSNFK